MAERDYKAIAERFREAFTVRHDAKAAAQLFSEDATLWNATLPEPLRGRKAIEEFMGAWLRAFPDMRVEIPNVVGSGDYCAFEWVMRGTHTGPLQGPQGEIPATGRRVDLRLCAILRLDARGLIAEWKGYFDTASMMQQLGLMPEAKAA
ncbi:MAG TPA: ester cyclase [Dehalococcoidia bacterium]|nr:ester cyclase [Dehalococcoidia bacterium]